ncbi:MAG: hypothetical protein LBD38_01950 [Streptococcaceae bacterium]|jgi:uncharacterized membrane protein YczE|nr:hypothetical protein [Streptococcaceae bacterium]
MKRKEFWIRFAFAFIGDIFLAIAASFLIKATLGVDAFTVENLGVSGKLGLDLGTYQLILGVAIGIIIVLLGEKKHLGVASAINIFLTGYFIDFCLHLLSGVSVDNVEMKVMFMVLGLIISPLGISMYSMSGLGAGPYDAIAPLMAEYTGFKFMYCRMITDGTFFLIGFLTGGPLGIASLLNVMTLGPLISLWNSKFTQPLLKKWIGEV